ncbi:metal/formaldehyde-sensitive transcriptional repressor [Tatumella ptyseos]|uniref:metal/formaldehyde-sensitive transcriptional repressor n=1 Tax=Tatumella ptyseos TaxID=82987 RepID=UPI0026EFC9FB|nr:metal/formaldehyde-sensitive transcriptional repressor [Tatumella ptyseos]WKX26930.1 metal/formaldehyde-sensitive transcriptional repressor [Tatumella ptyseos]
MGHVIKNKKAIITRIRRIKGQASSLETAVETGEDCLKVLQQVAAIRGAVNGLMSELLEDHIREHLLDEHADSDTRKNDLDEVITVIRSYLK